MKVVKISAGDQHMGILNKEGKLYTWGYNDNGQLGHAMRNCFPEPVEVPLGDPVSKVRAGWMCTVYVTESARPIVCGGIKAEGPGVADMQKPVGEDGEPAPEMEKGG